MTSEPGPEVGAKGSAQGPGAQPPGEAAEGIRKVRAKAATGRGPARKGKAKTKVKVKVVASDLAKIRKKVKKKLKKLKKEAVIIRFESEQLSQIDARAHALGLTRAAWVRMTVAQKLDAE